jgi:hypothetical protein
MRRSSRRLPRPSKASDFAAPRRACSGEAGSRRPIARARQRMAGLRQRSPPVSAAAFLSVRRSTAHEVEGIRRAPREGRFRFVAEARTLHTRLWNRGRSLAATLAIDGGCQPPSGARSQRFYALSEPSSPRPWPAAAHEPKPARSTPTRCATRIPRDRPGLFHPGNARELPPSGLFSRRRSEPVSRLAPALPFVRRFPAVASRDLRSR